MGDEIFQAINDNSPIIAWIHNISLNQQKYLKSKIKVCGLVKNDKHATNELMDGDTLEIYKIDRTSNLFHYLTRIQDYDFGHNVRYLMFIYDNPNCSQEDLVNMFCQSKGNIAKILKKFEDGGYIKREINPQNRRKYMLNTTDKANELIPEFRQISKDWDRAVGLTDEDEEFKNRLREIAINGMGLLEDSQ